MKYWDGDVINDEDLIGIYPRRLMIKDNYEIWQYPYVTDDTLQDENDIVGISFSKSLNRIYLFSPFVNRLEDMEYLNRISILVHDLMIEFDIIKVNKMLYPVDAIKYMKQHERHMKKKCRLLR